MLKHHAERKNGRFTVTSEVELHDGTVLAPGNLRADRPIWGSSGTRKMPGRIKGIFWSWMLSRLRAWAGERRST